MLLTLTACCSSVDDGDYDDSLVSAMVEFEWLLIGVYDQVFIAAARPG